MNVNLKTIQNPWIMIGLKVPVHNNPLKTWDIMTYLIEQRYQIEWDLVISKKRYIGITYLRQMASYWFFNQFKEDSRITLNWIGSRLGGRDHTTVMYSNDVFQLRLDTDEKLGRLLFPVDYQGKYNITIPGDITTIREDYEQFQMQMKLKLWL